MKENNLQEFIIDAIVEHYDSVSDEEFDILQQIDEQFIADVVLFSIENPNVEITEELFTEEVQQLDEILPVVLGLARAAHLGYKAYRGYKKAKKVSQMNPQALKKGFQKAKSAFRPAVNRAASSKAGSIATAKSAGKALGRGLSRGAWNLGRGGVQTATLAPSAHKRIAKASMALQTGRWAGGAKGEDGGSPIPGDPTYIHRKAYDKISSGIGDSLPKGTSGDNTGSVGGDQGQPGTTPPPTLEPGDKIKMKLGRGNRRKSGNPFSKLQTNSYEFQVDVNENIIGATFAKGTNQGNFNNEVDAVKDALAQIQELSPQTISSYQKKAGKEYRQAKGERPMHPEYSAGLNAAGRMTDKDMDDNDKAYDKMKKRGRGLAMSKGKGVQKEETQIDELAPLITSVLAAKAGRNVVKKVMGSAKGRTKFGPNKMDTRPSGPPPPTKPSGPPPLAPSGPPNQPAKPSIPPGKVGGAAPKPKLKGKGPKPLEGSRPSYNAGSTKPAPKRTYGPGNQMQSYDYGMEEGAMKELVTKKQEDERLAKRKKDSQYSDKEVRMGQGVAFDKRYKGGNMTGAYKTINKIKKGLGDHPKVADALRRANEEFNNEGERNG